jgi:hypothetical protein
MILVGIFVVIRPQLLRHVTRLLRGNEAVVCAVELYDPEPPYVFFNRHPVPGAAIT